MKPIFNIIPFLLLTINLTVQTTYYVKDGGNNNGGLDQANAFSTICNAQEAAIDGDKIIVVGYIKSYTNDE